MVFYIIIAYNFSVFIIMNGQAYLFYLLWTIFRKVIRTIGPSDYWIFQLLGFHNIGPSENWAFGLSGLRTIGPSDYRAFGLLGRHHIIPWSNSNSNSGNSNNFLLSNRWRTHWIFALYAIYIIMMCLAFTMRK